MKLDLDCVMWLPILCDFFNWSLGWSYHIRQSRHCFVDNSKNQTRNVVQDLLDDHFIFGISSLTKCTKIFALNINWNHNSACRMISQRKRDNSRTLPCNEFLDTLSMWTQWYLEAVSSSFLQTQLKQDKAYYFLHWSNTS